ncbi:MAG: hypothetical protein E7172_04890 [Firmicutes bacterium]|nr:hypothetical protein [Bacillota bacterium]
MKATFNFSLLFLIFAAIVGLNTKVLINEKITFREGNLDLVSSSLSDEVLSTEEMKFDNINLKVNLDVDNFYYPCNITMDSTDEEVEEYKRLSRSYAKNYYKEKNGNVVSSLKVNGYLDKYVSSYAPIVEFEFTPENYLKYGKEVLTELSSCNAVDSICVSSGSQVQLEPQMILSLNVMNAYNDYQQGLYTGEGVRVGVLESGVVDEDHENFSSDNLTVRNVWYFSETVTEHATQMASLIGGYNGIAPDAKIYSVQAYGELTGEIDWLLDNNVDIINMSFAYEEYLGTYDDYSAYVDYIAYHYNVTFVGCASNNIGTTHKVANPNLGYNVLTVGATSYSDILCGFSSYLTDPVSFKPDILAPGANICVPGYTSGDSGTSYSTAIVSGTLALLMERIPALKARPPLVKALACGSAEYVGYTSFEINGYDEKLGAGRFNYYDFGLNYGFYTNEFNVTSSSPANLKNIKIHLYEGETINICLSWLAYTDGTRRSIDMTAYELVVTNSNGILITKRDVQYSNTLFISLDIQYDDRYTISVNRITSGNEMVNPNGEYVAYDMNIFDTPSF